jgi:phage major head subunit gpT-like protein
MRDLLENGATNVCFDGQYFFDTDHPVNPLDSSKGTYQNLWASGKALTGANAAYVRAQMRKYKSEKGLPLATNPRLLIVPPALETTAIQICKNQFDAAGASNTYQGMFDYLVLPELTSDTAWYLFDVSRPVKPLVLQNRRPLAVLMKAAVTDDNVFFENELVFGVDARYNVGYSLPFLAAKADS